ncbi:MAG: hypothetical protein AAFN63_02130 [Pseudomonadota bacterium]
MLYDVAPKMRDTVFVAISIMGSGLLFIASLCVAAYADLADFGAVSSVLALAYLFGTVLQLGSNFALPKIAKHNIAELPSAVATKTVVPLIMLVFAVCCTLLLARKSPVDPAHHTIMVALILGCIIGVQANCESLFRALSRPEFVAALNVALAVGMIIAVVLGIISETLTAWVYLGFIFLARLLFIGIAIACSIRYFRLSNIAKRHLTVEGLRGQSLTVLVLWLAAGDLVFTNLISSNDPYTLGYVAIKHFCFGIYLALVQECFLPIFIRRILAMRGPKNTVVLSFALLVAVTTFIACTAVIALLAYSTGDERLALNSQQFVTASLNIAILAFVAVLAKSDFVFHGQGVPPVGMYIAVAATLTSLAITHAGFAKVSIISIAWMFAICVLAACYLLRQILVFPVVTASNPTTNFRTENK